jgi:hypothetical protein
MNWKNVLVEGSLEPADFVICQLEIGLAGFEAGQSHRAQHGFLD